MIDTPRPIPVDTSVPHPARTWSYWAGGKDHFPADRRVGEAILGVLPRMGEIARADRWFLSRVVRFLAGAGIRQFVDVGTGIPDDGHVHHIAQGIEPSCRVVYVDSDPVVLAHARALLVSAPAGAVDYLHADLADPELILAGAGATLDFTCPVAVLLLAVVEFVADDEQAYAAVARLVAALPSGSYLVLAHSATTPGSPDAATEAQMAEAARLWNASGARPVTPRTPEAIGRFFTGLQVLDPGVVPVSCWRPEPDAEWAAQDLPFVGGVARKP